NIFILTPIMYVLFALVLFFFFFSSRRRHTRSKRDWSSDVCSSDLAFIFTKSDAVIDLIRYQPHPIIRAPGGNAFHVLGRNHRTGRIIWRGQNQSVQWFGGVLSKIGRASCRERV